MKTLDMIGLLGIALVAGSACSGTARGLETYRTDTQTLLDSRDAQLQHCYDDALKSDSKLTGTVTVAFVVEKSSGQIANPIVDAAKSTAPKALGDCVVKTVQGLKLDPGDRNEGRATFVYEFKPAPAATPAT